jgi:hypothetical protein
MRVLQPIAAHDDADASHAAGQQHRPQHIILIKQQQHPKGYSDVGYCRRDLYDKCKLIMLTSGHPVGPRAVLAWEDNERSIYNPYVCMYVTAYPPPDSTPGGPVVTHANDVNYSAKRLDTTLGLDTFVDTTLAMSLSMVELATMLMSWRHKQTMLMMNRSRKFLNPKCYLG